MPANVVIDRGSTHQHTTANGQHEAIPVDSMAVDVFRGDLESSAAAVLHSSADQRLNAGFQQHQLALDLAKLASNLNSSTSAVSSSNGAMPTSLSCNGRDASPVVAATAGGLLSDMAALGGKKSANMTECVPVPTSEHVAEIVGRQGIALML